MHVGVPEVITTAVRSFIDLATKSARNRNGSPKCSKILRFEPLFHRLIGKIELYMSVKERFKTVHFSPFLEADFDFLPILL